MFPILRWETLHPALVHFTLGAVPLILLAYSVGAWRRSERWTFVGDVVTIATAIVTIFVALSGWIALVRVAWPGGLESWRNLHVAFGLLTSVGLLVLAGFRLRARSRGDLRAGLPAALSAAALGLSVIATGWIGGEVLVFQSGIAVESAAGGALSPGILPPSDRITGRPRTDPPRDLRDAMHRVRGAWAEMQTVSARMTVQKPEPEGFRRIVRASSQIEALFIWIEEHGASEILEPGAPMTSRHLVRGEPEGGVHRPETRRNHFVRMADETRETAARVRKAAAGRDLAGVNAASGELTATCSGCHADFRWTAPHEH